MDMLEAYLEIICIILFPDYWFTIFVTMIHV